MLNDIEIAKKTKLRKINDIAKELKIDEQFIHQCGHHIAKISHHYLRELNQKENGKLILVTAINPTPAGEGKTTTSIGLSMAINKLGKKSIVTLREPSLGPVMGIKGGAAGGGYSQVLPMEDINLHFTGDIHAVTTAHNLVSAVIDAHIKYGNELNIDETRIFWKRAMDMNDRALRQIVISLGGRANGYPREDGFVITAASEIMAVLCLAEDIPDLKRRLQNIVIARNIKGKPITIGDLKIEGALAVVLKDALNPNLVQTIEGTPAFIHGGPFANIAHGTNSLISTKMALKISDYVVTESGFGADLGAEKFLDFVSPAAGFKPNVIVLVATIRALKYNGKAKELDKEDMDALRNGIVNLRIHIENLQKFGIPIVVALNKFDTDTDTEIKYVVDFVENMNTPIAINNAYYEGSNGALELAQKVINAAEKDSELTTIYNWHDPLEVKIMKLAKEIYRAKHVDYELSARNKIKFFKKFGYDHLPVIVAKTQYSISDDPKKLGAPSNYNFTIRDFELSAGAGFIVALAGEIMRMPGLPKISNAVHLDIDAKGNITGLS
ncbi:Formate-tetrahydrofolate ligase [Marinitoga hydrogenitolerans DSM 16785]|uniref:Formate--tetrahydrofolate ligase n=1 Tax=Marinitoga hydrogenitolerans (strain DSM 16785 / JCM 12826 / AT1271) TaxID=1122195 RepID=A0A1M4V7Y6_MARH1|nr:formate--tetrahydrofolate ligase [Marinitoga hydrogenitolerans]SHE65000.1 Formate-tetrahydrofolate ligase [Marinitoga hydrogenitolerans DSM 16785]